MSIDIYTGTPGSGKSLNVARLIKRVLTVYKMPVIANFPINIDLVSKRGKRKIGKFFYKMNDELTVQFLKDFAYEHNPHGKEDMLYLVIDEAAIMFNSRDYGMFDRKAWVNFFMTHRHYGYKIILVCQFDRMLDRQVRCFVEYEYRHRKANNFGFIGFLFTVFRIPFFVCVRMWYGIKLKDGQEFFMYRKSDGKLYDTMMLFGGNQHGKRIGEKSKAAVSEGGDTGACAGGAPPSEPPQVVIDADLLKPPDSATW